MYLIVKGDGTTIAYVSIIKKISKNFLVVVFSS